MAAAEAAYLAAVFKAEPGIDVPGSLTSMHHTQSVHSVSHIPEPTGLRIHVGRLRLKHAREDQFLFFVPQLECVHAKNPVARAGAPRRAAVWGDGGSLRTSNFQALPALSAPPERCSLGKRHVCRRRSSARNDGLVLFACADGGADLFLQNIRSNLHTV